MNILPLNHIEVTGMSHALVEYIRNENGATTCITALTSHDGIEPMTMPIFDPRSEMFERRLIFGTMPILWIFTVLPSLTETIAAAIVVNHFLPTLAHNKA